MLSQSLWWALRRVPMPLAAKVGNILYSDRQFSVDQDGDWINRQPDATFASPEIHAQRRSSVEAMVSDEWFWQGVPKGIVLDIGAGIGEEAVIMARSASHVYAIEAHPDTFRCLEKTIRLSGLTNVTPIQCAIVDKDEPVNMGTGDLLGAAVGSGELVVEGRSVSSLCDELGIKQIDFIRMNIEGAERLAVMGLGDVLIERFAISCHDFRDDAKDNAWFRTRAEVEAILTRRGVSIKRRAGHKRTWTAQTVFGKTCKSMI